MAPRASHWAQICCLQVAISFSLSLSLSLSLSRDYLLKPSLCWKWEKIPISRDSDGSGFLVKQLPNKTAQVVFREGMSQNLWEGVPVTVTSRPGFCPVCRISWHFQSHGPCFHGQESLAEWQTLGARRANIYGASKRCTLLGMPRVSQSPTQPW